MTTAEYWKCLPLFDHVVTYSFNRGPKLAQLIRAAGQRRRQLRSQLLQSSGPALRALRVEMRRCEDYPQELENATLTDGPTAWHLTASPVATLPAAELTSISQCLRRPVQQRFAWMCWPVYRDALAFYAADGRLLSVLNICFQCERMQTDTGQEVEADAAVYQDLKVLLRRLGHPITDGLEDLPRRQ